MNMVEIHLNLGRDFQWGKLSLRQKSLHKKNNKKEYSLIKESLIDCKRRVNGDCKCVNEVTCAKRIIKNYIKDDYDILIKLKAQARDADPKSAQSNTLAFAAIGEAVLAMYVASMLALTDNLDKNLYNVNMYGNSVVYTYFSQCCNTIY